MREHEGDSVKTQGCTPIELLGIVGFALNIGWMFVSCFWLFSEFPYNYDLNARCICQLCVFVGMGTGFILLHFLGKHPRFNPFALPAVVTEFCLALLLPVCALLQHSFPAFPLILICAVCSLTGMSSSASMVSWLDVCSRLETRLYGRFIGTSFFLGSLLFLLAALTPMLVGALFGIAYPLSSIGLLLYCSAKADGNGERAPLDSVSKGWGFSKEVEPSFFMFSMTFGMAFAWLFNVDSQAVALGLLSVVPGSLCIAALSWLNIRVDITLALRILLCLCVFSCVFMPLSTDTGKLICTCLNIAAWAMFMCLNYSFIVKKSVIMRDAPLFRQAPQRCAVPALGMAAGWAVICTGTILYGAGSDAFITVRLVVAFLLVVVFVLFFPTQMHHSIDREAQPSPGNAAGLGEQELFEMRVKGIARDYKLSRRETEIFRYLARGRNAAFIQQKLMISPHTVKSHMYNIYGKLGVHSQQEILDMMESYAVDPV
ncbi:MAG: response regulator transcription factor, partial [Coriobacteriales bacterium]